MIVFCSWVTFFLIKTEKGGEVPARTALGANSILSIVNVGFGGKSRYQEFITYEAHCTRSGHKFDLRSQWKFHWPVNF